MCYVTAKREKMLENVKLMRNLDMKSCPFEVNGANMLPHEAIQITLKSNFHGPSYETRL